MKSTTLAAIGYASGVLDYPLTPKQKEAILDIEIVTGINILDVLKARNPLSIQELVEELDRLNRQKEYKIPKDTKFYARYYSRMPKQGKFARQDRPLLRRKRRIFRDKERNPKFVL